MEVHVIIALHDRDHLKLKIDPVEPTDKNALLDRFWRSPQTQVQPPHNQVLHETSSYIVTGTLGPLVPNWLIVWTKKNFLSFRDASEHDSVDCRTILGELLVDRLLERCIWFEHGPGHKKSLVGCGVTHAHFHILIDPGFDLSEFKASATKLSKTEWTLSNCPIKNIPTTKDYHMFGDLAKRYQKIDTAKLGSQFFRRVVAELVSKPNEWNYKHHPFFAVSQQFVEAVNLAPNSIFRQK